MGVDYLKSFGMHKEQGHQLNQTHFHHIVAKFNQRINEFITWFITLITTVMSNFGFQK